MQQKLWTKRLNFASVTECGCRQGVSIQGAAGVCQNIPPLLTTNNAETLIMARTKIMDCLRTIKFLPTGYGNSYCVRFSIVYPSISIGTGSLSVPMSHYRRVIGRQRGQCMKVGCVARYKPCLLRH